MTRIFKKSLNLLGASACILAILTVAGCGGGDDNNLGRAATPDQTIPVAPPVVTPLAPDVAYADATQYTVMADENVSAKDANEGAAVTHHDLPLNGTMLRYTATVGHLIAYSGDGGVPRPQATMFYVAYTLDGAPLGSRPITFFFNGGPGSPSSYLLMGSYGPKRVTTSQAGSGPNVTTRAPYHLVDNAETLLDKSDLVFVDPVGTGYSSAIAPNKNSDFWSTDTDVDIDSLFIRRYLTVNGRYTSPIFLFGESYGGPRTSIMSYVLQARYGIQLNGLILQSPALNYYDIESQQPGASTAIPDFVFAVDVMSAWYYKKLSAAVQAEPAAQIAAEATAFITGPYLNIDDKTKWPAIQPEYLRLTGLDKARYTPDDAGWANAEANLGPVGWNKAHTQFNFASKLSVLLVPGKTLGMYDTRQSAGAEITQLISDYLVYDPSLVNLDPAYKGEHNAYVSKDLKYNTLSNYAYLGTLINANGEAVNDVFDHRHTTPDGVEHGTPDATVDLKAEMFNNPAMQVFATEGYYDNSTNFANLHWDLATMQLPDNLQANVTELYTEAGHMSYSDDKARSLVRKNIGPFYDKALTPEIMQKINAMKRASMRY